MGAKQVKMLRFLDNDEDRKSIDKAFAAYDKDENGTLSREEFLAFAGDVVEHLVKKHPELKVGELGLFRDASEGKADLKMADEDIKNRVVGQLARAMFQVIDKDGSGTISLDEWKATQWATLVKGIKGHMKDQERMLVNALTGGPVNGRWELTLSGANDTHGIVTFKDATTITGKLGYHPLTPASAVTGTRILLYGQVPRTECPSGAEFQLLLDAIYSPTGGTSDFPYELSGHCCVRLSGGTPLFFGGEVTASLTPW